MILFARRLLGWYDSHKRQLPWRNCTDAYPRWISEVILQQTRIAQGMEYYERFLSAFPTVRELAAAPEDMVLKMWEGLGYYSRARNLHAAAKQVVEMGGFPTTQKELLQLKGVGEYIASAIASMVYNEPVPAVDGNAYRVIGRIFGVEIPIDTAKGKNYYRNLIESLMDKSRPGDFNQAMMDFGALQCVPRNPECENCPFVSMCVAYGEGKYDAFPVKSHKVVVKKRYLNYFIVRSPQGVLARRREGNDIWRWLYEPYLIESRDMAELYQMDDEWLQNILKGPDRKIRVIAQQLKHILTHRELLCNFYGVDCLDDIDCPPDYQWYAPEQWKALAFPQVVRKLIDKKLDW